MVFSRFNLFTFLLSFQSCLRTRDMLIKIREKSQGVFAWIILLLICVPFALWGIQNYVGGGSEATIATVGDKEFFQQDLNRAYEQFRQRLAGQNFDETGIKKQALDQLIRDEVLLQYVEKEGLIVNDQTTKKFIKELDYFQTDGKFDKKQYKAILAAQRMSPAEFANRIKKAQVMEQFQRSVVDSAFVTPKDIENFFLIQNQKRNVEIVSIALEKVEEQPTEAEIDTYYQQQQNLFLTDEQVSIEYVELSLDNLAKQVIPSEEQLKEYYKEQKDQYETKERRKISHILFAISKDDGDDKKQLERALKAKQELIDKDFSDLAKEISDDKLTASKGGDLGLFNVGVMEKSFEEAASSLKLGEVSEPVKSAFGYHLIKVTELVKGESKSFDDVKDKITTAFQRSEAENTFYELGETLTEVSYENPDSLQAVADAIGIEIKETGLFGKKAVKDKADDNITSKAVVINAAFSKDVLEGNNSEPIELGTDRMIVLRMLQYKPSEVKALKEVKKEIITTLLKEKATERAIEKAEIVRKAVIGGQTLKTVAKENDLKVKKFSDLTRASGDLDWHVNQAIFKAAKPAEGKATVITVADPTGAQTVINLLSVTDGVMSESDKSKKKLAETNMAKAFGQADFNATLSSLQSTADISINLAE